MEGSRYGVRGSHLMCTLISFGEGVIKLLNGIRRHDDNRVYNGCHIQPFNRGVGRIPNLLCSPIEEPMEHITGHTGIADKAYDLTGKRTIRLGILTCKKRFAESFADKKYHKHPCRPENHLKEGMIKKRSIYRNECQQE